MTIQEGVAVMPFVGEMQCEDKGTVLLWIPRSDRILGQDGWGSRFPGSIERDAMPRGGEKRVGLVVSIPLFHHGDGFEDDGILRNHRTVLAAEALGCCAAKAGSSL